MFILKVLSKNDSTTKVQPRYNIVGELITIVTTGLPFTKTDDDASRVIFDATKIDPIPPPASSKFKFLILMIFSFGVINSQCIKNEGVPSSELDF